MNAFHVACARGHVDIARLLVSDSRIDPMDSDADGLNAFHLACKEGHTEIVRLLLVRFRNVVVGYTNILTKDISMLL